MSRPRAPDWVPTAGVPTAAFWARTTAILGWLTKAVVAYSTWVRDPGVSWLQGTLARNTSFHGNPRAPSEPKAASEPPELPLAESACWCGAVFFVSTRRIRASNPRTNPANQATPENKWRKKKKRGRRIPRKKKKKKKKKGLNHIKLRTKWQQLRRELLKPDKWRARKVGGLRSLPEDRLRPIEIETDRNSRSLEMQVGWKAWRQGS